MGKISHGLETIAKAVKSTGQESLVSEAIDSTLTLVAEERSQATAERKTDLEKLENELLVWRSKLGFLLKEPAGRQGIAKHAQYWVETLTRNSSGK